MLAIEAKTLDPGFRRDDRFRDDSSSIVIRAQAHYCQGYLPEYDNLLFFVTPLRTMSPRFCWGDGIWLHRPKNRHHLHVMTAAWADRMRSKFPTRSRRKPGSSVFALLTRTQ